MIAFIRDCGWQVILAAILLVQFVTIVHLRRVVRVYEDHYYGVAPQVQVQPMVQQQQAPLRPLRPLRRR